MSPTWDDGADPPEHSPLGAADWARIVSRGVPIVLLLVAGVPVLLLVQLLERPFAGARRPLSPGVVQLVCCGVLRLMGLRVSSRGPRLEGAGAIVANHTSWLDIFVLNACRRVFFVSKSEVARWPGIGLLARVTGTVFITRDRREAEAATSLLRDRLRMGHRLLFFPEGTSTDGLRVLPFKSTLFGAFFDESLLHEMQVQAVSVVYHAPDGADARFYGWWGDMDFGPSALRLLAQSRQGRVDVRSHPPVRVDDFANRKSLARYLEDQVRRGHASSG